MTALVTVDSFRRPVATFKASSPDCMRWPAGCTATRRWMLVNFRQSTARNRLYIDLVVSKGCSGPHTSITSQDWTCDGSLSITAWILSNFPSGGTLSWRGMRRSSLVSHVIAVSLGRQLRARLVWFKVKHLRQVTRYTPLHICAQWAIKRVTFILKTTLANVSPFNNYVIISRSNKLLNKMNIKCWSWAMWEWSLYL